MTDVYFFGHVTTGIFLRLKGPYPAPDGYAEVAETLESHAGEATAGALVLARLGLGVTLEGNWIGDNPACRRTLDFLRDRGIDCSGLVVQPGYPGATEVIVSDGETRTFFGRSIDLLFTTPQWPPPDAHRIRAARVVCVDPSFGETTLFVARTAKAAGRPLVTSDARHDSELAALADIVVISDEFLRREYPDAVESGAPAVEVAAPSAPSSAIPPAPATPPDRRAAARLARERLFADYLQHCPGLVVFTTGADPLWFGRRGNTPRRELPPFPVEVVDSAGAGDSFRGGLIYGLLHRWSDEDMLRFANAVAALICTTAPGCVHPPTLAQVRAFLADRGAPLPSD